jgi:SAM-dependent methyltransferase
MAHLEQLYFASIIAKNSRQIISRGSILEVGSYAVNGSIRPFFESCTPVEYIGVDLVEGPCVDIVKSGHELEYEDNHFDLAISCECFEHNLYWAETFTNMIRMTKPGGIVAISCASRGRVEHGTSRAENPGAAPGTSARGSEYYRNLGEKDFTESVPLNEHFVDYRFYYNHSHRDLFFVGLKKGPDPNNTNLPLNQIYSEVRDIGSRCRRKKGVIKTVAKEVALNLPLGALSRVLPEDTFQNFAIPYWKLLKNLSGSRIDRWFKQN